MSLAEAYLNILPQMCLIPREEQQGGGAAICELINVPNLSVCHLAQTLEKQNYSFTMAVAAAATKSSHPEDLTCAICCNLFREPVMLACMHHFCRPSISSYWRGTHGPVTCPQCRKEFSTKHFQTNDLVTAWWRRSGPPPLTLASRTLR